MPSWMYFVLALAGLLAGYCVYGAIVEKVFGPDPNRPTPACKMPDGVDYVEMSPTKVFLIQLLNIAGLGPVFGPILGALYGPIALLWVVIGCVFAGAVHDYFSGMLSVRYNGKSVPDIVGYNLGDLIKKLMRVFAVVLLILVGVVFVAGPAGLLSQLTGMHSMLFVAIIFAYYFLATILPVDKIIGRVYPFFAVLLVFMAVGLLGALAFKGYTFYSNIEWTMHSPSGLPAWPLVFITIACGACSGFHATQSPLMARCINNEKHGRKIFYGAMIAVPLFVVGVALNFIPFGMLWRYFGFANQALAAIMLWAAAAYLLHRGKFHWIASVPACFMTAVSAVYICFEKTMGFGMSYELSNIVGIAIALICFALLLTAGRKVQPTDDLSV